MKKLINAALTSQILATSVTSFKKSVPLFLGLIVLATATSSMALTIPESDEDYPGASLAFTAIEPYRLNIQDTSVFYDLYDFPRRYDFSGKVPFVNPQTNKADPAQLQYNGTFLNGNSITVAGVQGRVDKWLDPMANTVTRVRYQANDNPTAGKCRTHINGYAIPPRTHVRWDLNVAFGGIEAENNWTLTTSGDSPVAFWEIKSPSQIHPPLAAIVDTDSYDSNKLMIFFAKKVGPETNPPTPPVRIAEVHGLSRNTYIPIVIEAFLDERSTANGGKGALKIWVNNALVTETTTPTLALGTGTHNWSIAMYLYNEDSAYPLTRASLWKTAKMIVFPKPD